MNTSSEKLAVLNLEVQSLKAQKVQIFHNTSGQDNSEISTVLSSFALVTLIWDLVF